MSRRRTYMLMWMQHIVFQWQIDFGWILGSILKDPKRHVEELLVWNGAGRSVTCQSVRLKHYTKDFQTGFVASGCAVQTSTESA
jgi:hypothetical protein